MYSSCQKSCCEIDINTDPWSPQCPICKSASEELNFTLKNNINSTQYIQALQYINSIHQLFNNAITIQEFKFSLPEVPNFLSLFSMPQVENKKDTDLLSTKEQETKRKPKLQKTTMSNKNLVAKKETCERKKVRKSTSENTSINPREWSGIIDTSSNVIQCCPLLITKEIAEPPFECRKIEKPISNEKHVKKPTRKRIPLPSIPKDKCIFRHQPDTLLHYSSDNIMKLKKSLSPVHYLEKKRKKNLFKSPPESPVSPSPVSTRHVQMQTSQCWSLQKIRQSASGVVRNTSDDQLNSIRTVSRKKSKKAQRVKTEYFENFVPMSKNKRKSKNVLSEASEITMSSNVSSIFKY